MARRNRSFFFDNKSGKLESDGKVVVDASNTTNILQTKGSTTGNPVALNAIGDDTNITINIGPKGSGLVQISSAYTLPKNDGTNGQVLSTNGSGALSFQSLAATDVTVSANNSTDETTYITFVDGATGSQGLETDTGLTYNPSSGLLTTDALTIAGNLTVDTDTLYVDSTNNSVGIGTSSPSQKLHVVGSIKGSQSITIGTGGLYEAGSIYSDSNWGMIFRAKQASPSQSDFRWANSADTERMRIDSSGNVGIGNTAPQSPLTVAGVIESTSGGVKFPDNTTQTTAASAGITEAQAIEYAIALG